MKMDRFDEVEFTVLNCAHRGAFIDRAGEYKDRALLLMELKVFEANPVENWWKTGWKFTDKGKKYHVAFLKVVRKNHGHTWRTNDDGTIDIFAYEIGNHNGMVCTKCGYSFCHLCTAEFEVEKCVR